MIVQQPDYSPLPWTYDDNRAPLEGKVAVYDAVGDMVTATGDMEDCTWRDICDAHLIAASGDLLAVCKNMLAALESDDFQWNATIRGIVIS